MEVSFPDRFHLATSFFDQTFGNLEESTKLDDMQKLAFYALRQQAEKGPCKEPAPYIWNVKAKYKHAAWCQLGNMSPFEAMVFFVQKMEEVCGADWILATKGQEELLPGEPPADEASLAHGLDSMSVDELRAEVLRLRQLLKHHGVVAEAPAVNPVGAAPDGRTARSAQSHMAVDIPKRDLLPLGTAAPPSKPQGSSTESSSEKASSTAVYYSNSRMGWLEWLGLSSSPPDVRIV